MLWLKKWSKVWAPAKEEVSQSLCQRPSAANCQNLDLNSNHETVVSIPVEIKRIQERFVCMGLCSPTKQSWTACLRKCENGVSLKRCVGISLSPALSFYTLYKTVNLHAVPCPWKRLSTRSFILRKKNDYRPEEDPGTVPPIHPMQTDKWLIPRNRKPVTL